ncbi:hypothetical protein [Legionella hackeliae]|nr:hypothetical protein [Legionella hackeliae]STX47118.1 Uncharacterised protein [Legionella hackeliae]
MKKTSKTASKNNAKTKLKKEDLKNSSGGTQHQGRFSRLPGWLSGDSKK